MSYTPQPGGAVIINFTGVYTPQPGGGVVIAFNAAPNTLYPTGIAAIGFGAQTIYNFIQYALPAGIAAIGFGSPSIKGSNTAAPSGFTDEAFGTADAAFSAGFQYAVPTGFTDEAFGTAAVSGRNGISATGFTNGSFGTAHIDYAQHLVSVNGINGFAFGAATFIDYGVRSRTPTGIAPKGFGTADVSFFNRTVDLAGRSILPKGFGTAVIDFGQRYLYPTGVIPGLFGRPLIDFTPLHINASGWSSSVFGSTTIHDNTQDINHLGLNSFASGLAFVAHDPQPVSPLGIQDFNTSPAHIYNLKQIIYPYFDPLSSERELFGDPIWTFVENRNRSIGPTGFAGRIGSANIANAAVPLGPSGFDAISFGAGTFISPANRSVTPTDEIVGYFGQWTAVTKPPELKPTGFVSSVFGTPAILNLNRTYSLRGFSDETVGGGDTFIDFAIRYLHPPLGPEGFYGMPDVQLKTRYISPNGFTPTFVFGAAELTIHFNIIGNHGWDSGRMGTEHRIYNSTPSINPYVFDASLYGATRIRNDHEFRAIQGFEHLAFGRTDISYRTKTLIPNGVSGIRFGLLHIYNDTPDPPGQQYIIPNGFVGTFGTSSVHRNEIDPTGFNAVLWGVPHVVLMGAEFVSIGDSSTFGTPHMVGPQYVSVPSTPGYPDVDDKFGSLRIDPFTIWCTGNIPPNPAGNPGSDWVPIDTFLDAERHQWDLFGGADVQNSQRYITNLHDPHDGDGRYGNALVDFYHRHLYPAGIKSPYIVGPGLNYPQSISLDDIHDGIPTQEAFGNDGIDYAPPYTKTAYPNTWLSQGLGVQRVEFLNRTIAPTGWDSSLMIRPSRVGYPIPMDAGLGYLTQFGSGGFVSYKNRDLPPEGWDDFLSEYDIEHFDQRMRVTRSAHDGVVAHGFDAGSFGAPGVHIGGPIVDIAYTDVLFDS